MNTMIETNNNVYFSGRIVSDFTFSHEILGEKFYSSEISITRYSGSLDIIPLIISERLLSTTKYADKSVIIVGQLRTHNNHTGNGSKLLIYVFVTDMMFNEENLEEDNYINLSGYICKKPTYRKTPLGREISDILIAVNRTCGKSDYIPCICWGRNAKFVQSMLVGDFINIFGRVQSRDYVKKDSNNRKTEKTAYEVSVCRIDYNIPDESVLF